MPRLDRLPELQRKSSLAHPCLLNDSSPFTFLRQPLSQSRLGLLLGMVTPSYWVSSPENFSNFSVWELEQFA